MVKFSSNKFSKEFTVVTTTTDIIGQTIDQQPRAIYKLNNVFGLLQGIATDFDSDLRTYSFTDEFATRIKLEIINALKYRFADESIKNTITTNLGISYELIELFEVATFGAFTYTNVNG
jgi:hypothetical protein